MSLKTSTANYLLSDFGANHVSDFGAWAFLPCPNAGHFQRSFFARKLLWKDKSVSENFSSTFSSQHKTINNWQNHVLVQNHLCYKSTVLSRDLGKMHVGSFNTRKKSGRPRKSMNHFIYGAKFKEQVMLSDSEMNKLWNQIKSTQEE